MKLFPNVLDVTHNKKERGGGREDVGKKLEKNVQE